MKAIYLLILLALSGCAQMTEQYWSEQYARMTPEELENARATGATVWDIYVDSLTNSHLVCVVVQVY